MKAIYAQARRERRQALPAPQEIAALVDSEVLRRYPDSASLEAALAARMGLPPERVIATAGADDAIDRAIRSYGRSGATVLSTAPAFEEYAAAAARSGARYLAVPRSPDGPFPLDALVAAIRAERPALVVVASPDNPGGGVDLAGRAAVPRGGGSGLSGAVVLFDVAYSDFDEDREVYELAQRPARRDHDQHLLEGLRPRRPARGLGGGSGERHRKAAGHGPPFALGSFSVAAAMAALASGAPAVEAFVAQVRRERPLLQAALARIGARTWEGKANFVAAIVPDAPAFSEALAKEGDQDQVLAGEARQGRPRSHNLPRGRVRVPDSPRGLGEDRRLA